MLAVKNFVNSIHTSVFGDPVSRNILEENTVFIKAAKAERLRRLESLLLTHWCLCRSDRVSPLPPLLWVLAWWGWACLLSKL